MRRGLRVAALTVIILGAAATQSLADSADKGSDGDFTGIALITDDAAWHRQFQQAQTPQISGQDHFGPGDRGTLALIFSNAEPRQGIVRIACDVTAYDPGGERMIVASGPCYEGPYAGPNILHPTLLDLTFTIGADDPPGEAGFKITLHDENSGRSVNLDVSFTQGAGE